MAQEFGPGIWYEDGPKIEGFAGFHYPTRMAVIRLDNGGLFIWSPISLTDPVRQWIDTLGPVRHIVAPNALHHVFLPSWQVAYPKAVVHGAPGVAQKRPEVQFGTELGDGAHDAWAGEIDQVIVPNSIADEVVFFHRASGTVLVTDLVQNLPRGWFKGWRKIVARLDSMIGDTPRVPRKFRMALRARDGSRAALAKVLDWPAEGVLMAHGTPVVMNGQAFLNDAFDWRLG